MPTPPVEGSLPPAAPEALPVAAEEPLEVAVAVLLLADEELLAFEVLLESFLEALETEELLADEELLSVEAAELPPGRLGKDSQAIPSSGPL